MRKALMVGTLAILLAGCGKKEEASDNAAADRASSAEMKPGAPPAGIGVNPGGGLAITYDYGFRLPAERVATMQEAHATQCEALGPAICRVTGMTYRVERNRAVVGMLAVRLAPDAARKFGKAAVDVVTRGGGMLASAEIASEDAGATIANARASRASLEAERTRIEQQLAQAGLGKDERRDLQARLESIAESLRQEQAAQSEASAKLANTPMTLHYESGEVDQSLSDGPIVGALKDGWGNIVATAGIVLTLLVTLLPWALLAWLATWIWRRFAHAPSGDHDVQGGAN